MITGILGKKLKTEVSQSVLQGDDVCKIKIHLELIINNSIAYLARGYYQTSRQD